MVRRRSLHPGRHRAEDECSEWRTDPRAQAAGCLWAKPSFAEVVHCRYTEGFQRHPFKSKPLGAGPPLMVSLKAAYRHRPLLAVMARLA